LKESYLRKKEILFERTILEAFSKDLMKQATEIFKSLQSIKFSQAGLKSLAAARDSAVHDVDSVLSSKSDTGLIKKFISLFKQSQNPLIDAFAFCDALKNFFEDFSTYIEAKKTGVDNPEDKTLKELIVGSTDQTTISGITDDRLRSENLRDLIIKGFQPDGAMKKLSKNWQKKYIKSNFSEIAKDLMNANVGKIEEISKEIVEKLSNVSEIAKSLTGAQNTAAKQTFQTSGTEQTNVSQPTGSSNISDPSSSKATAGADDVVNKLSASKKQAVKTANELYASMEDKFGNIDSETVRKIIAVLAWHDNIKI